MANGVEPEIPTEEMTGDDGGVRALTRSHALELSRLRQGFQRRQKSVRRGSSCEDTVWSVDSTGYRFAAAMSGIGCRLNCLAGQGLNSDRKAFRLFNRFAQLARQEHALEIAHSCDRL